jgi:hypothetical protein
MTNMIQHFTSVFTKASEVREVGNLPSVAAGTSLYAFTMNALNALEKMNGLERMDGLESLHIFFD